MANPGWQFVQSISKIASIGNLQETSLNRFPLQLHQKVYQGNIFRECQDYFRELFWLYWVGQKVRSRFWCAVLGKTQTNFLANPILKTHTLYNTVHVTLEFKLLKSGDVCRDMDGPRDCQTE